MQALMHSQCPIAASSKSALLGIEVFTGHGADGTEFRADAEVPSQDVGYLFRKLYQSSKVPPSRSQSSGECMCVRVCTRNTLKQLRGADRVPSTGILRCTPRKL